ncbi:uncharacterized protein CEXT_659041 [Caerostris extrusa]|uniref:Granulins domain-containing protein n=1 Tax=Caerostris extrusa TaxID=172846 RepID=A0AAV4WAQ5_CAEEX|nr:uncharacterized protein CEXT_659041 [Caerostris extrusa]
MGCLSKNGKAALLSLENGLDITQPENTMMGQSLKEMGIEICPDKLHMCPATADCCEKDNGKWDCCPKTNGLTQFQASAASIWDSNGPAALPAYKCHWFGCWWK